MVQLAEEKISSHDQVKRAMSALNTMPWRMIWVAGWVAQVTLVITLPEVADEAYYERWGEVTRLGYLDHPPAVAWWSRLGGRWLNLTLLPIA